VKPRQTNPPLRPYGLADYEPEPKRKRLPWWVRVCLCGIPLVLLRELFR